MLTQERLKEVLKYDRATGIFVLLKSRKRSLIGSVVGSVSKSGYVQVSANGITYPAHRLAWLYVYGYLPENHIDHIDRDRSNNAISNLREVSRSCNARNSGNPKNNKSGVKGVSRNSRLSQWHAKIIVNGENVYLGTYVSFLEAVCHRLAAEQAEDWADCDSSSPAYQYVRENIKCN